MKFFQKLSLLSAAIAVLSAVSCVNEPFSGEGQEADGPIASVEQQIVYVKSSASLISSVQTGIDKMVEEIENDALAASLETLYDEFTNRGDALEDHIGFLRNGASWLEATMATLEQQKALAYVNGALYAAVDKEELKVAFESHLKAPLAELAESADKWIGASYETYYSVAQTAGTLEYLLTLAGRQLGDDKGGLEGLLSDIEAGLRDGAEPSEFKALISVVDGNASALEQLHATVQSVVAELEAEYAKAFEAALSGSGDYSAKTLKKANTKASAELQNATTSLNDLVARIEDCEADIEALKTKVGELEADVDELLGMIQSVTFMSQYSEEYVIAYYNMDNNSKVTAPGMPYDGKSVRTPVETIELNYMIRPASAAAAVTKDVVSVVGYYADQIQTKSIDPTRFVNFAVTDVSVNAERGIVTVTVSHDLKDDFYYRETGAKCALFIATGQTDVTSKFVEIYPKDKSTNVYVDGIKIDVNEDVIEIDEGKTKTLTAVVTPSDATNKTVTWSSSNPDLATINAATGELTGVSAGNVTITATTNDINEWGDNLTASVNVKVNPSIRLGGPLYVEVGKNAELSLSYPPEMNIESIAWMSSTDITADNEYTGVATVDDNGTVTGVKYYYNTSTYTYDPAVVISCIINGNITLTHEMHVTALQPTGIRFNDYADDATSVSMKLDGTISLAGTLLPDNVEAEYFTIKYAASKGGSAVWGFVDSSSGSIKTPGSTGTWTVTATVDDENDKDNRLTKNVKRSIVVNVEPYYVKTMRFAQENFTLPPGQTATILPIFTSDVENMPPTSTKLAWESSAPEVVSVDPSTGEMTSHTEGTAVITATTSEASAVPSGHAPVSASFTVIAETPTKPVYVGDYFYSDGDWSTELILDTDGDDRADRSVVGIVFSNVPATSDARLMEEYPAATHGLVVGLVEYTEPTGYYSNVGWDSNSGIVVKAAGYDIFNTNIANGYTNTIGLKEYSKTGDSGYDLSDGSPLYYAHLFRDDAGVFAEPLVATPSGASTWYIPSYYEMSLMKANLTTINNAFAKLREEQLSATDISSSGQYSISTFKEYIRSVFGESVPQGSLESICCYSISSGGWVSVGNNVNNPVRVVLAF